MYGFIKGIIIRGVYTYVVNYIWSMSKFQNRYFLFREKFDEYFETKILPPKNNDDDPFWDPPEPQLLGQGFLLLESLAYLIDNPTEIQLIGDKGTIGKLSVNLVPLHQNGEPIGEECDLEEPEDLIGNPLNFEVQVHFAVRNQDYGSFYVKYSILGSDGMYQTIRSDKLDTKTSNPQFNFVNTHSFEKVDAKILDYLLNSNLKIQLYGCPITEGERLSSSSDQERKSERHKKRNRKSRMELQIERSSSSDPNSVSDASISDAESVKPEGENIILEPIKKIPLNKNLKAKECKLF